MDVDTTQQWAADFLLVAGDGYGDTAALFDGGVVEAAGGRGCKSIQLLVPAIVAVLQ